MSARAALWLALGALAAGMIACAGGEPPPGGPSAASSAAPTSAEGPSASGRAATSGVSAAPRWGMLPPPDLPPGCPRPPRIVPARIELTLAGRTHPPMAGPKEDLVGRPIAIAPDLVGFAEHGEVQALALDGAEKWAWSVKKRRGPDGVERWPLWGADGAGRVVAWWPESGRVAVRAPDGKIQEHDVPPAAGAGRGAPVMRSGRLWLRAGPDEAGPWLGAFDPALEAFTPGGAPGAGRTIAPGAEPLDPRLVMEPSGCAAAELLGGGPPREHLVERHDVPGERMVLRADAVSKEKTGPPELVRLFVWRIP